MRALTIEFLRFGGDAHILSKGDRYIVTMGSSYRPEQVDMPMNELDFRYKLQALRYDGKADTGRSSESENPAGSESKPAPGPPPTSSESITLKDAVLSFFPHLSFQQFHKQLEKEPFIQVDLVTSASELWSLPFEILYKDGPFKIGDTNVVLTRRIRKAHHRSTEVNWPETPRILFASAHPDWLKAPHPPFEEHKSALQKALNSWLHPAEMADYEFAIKDYSSHITALQNASLSDIHEAIKEAENAKKPYSHIHVLAHGVESGNHFTLQYGIALNGEKDEVTMPADLAHCLSEVTTPLVVSLSVCDSGNPVNPIRPGNVAQALHVAGIPIVIASQFPLTMDGSNVFVREFYESQLKGDDIRVTLHTVRKSLAKEAKIGHDYVSLVGYVELPEGYGDYLKNFHVRSQFVQLGVLKKWADYITRDKSKLNESNVNLLRKQFTDHLEFFACVFDRLVLNYAENVSMLEEISGLMGSAYKIWAEVEYLFGEGKNASSDELLSNSRQKYLWAFEKSFNAHWNGTQFLSLALVLDGAVQNPMHWTILELAALRDARDPRDFWAYGNLFELYLLKHHAVGESGFDDAKAAVCEMLERLKIQPEDDSEFAINSAKRQLRKYIDWWTSENGYFPDCEKDVSEDARELLEIFDAG